MTADEEDDDRIKHPKISAEQAPLTMSITFTASYFSEPADPLVRLSPSPPPASPSPLITFTTSALVPELADPLVLRRQSSPISTSRSLSSGSTLSPSPLELADLHLKILVLWFNSISFAVSSFNILWYPPVASGGREGVEGSVNYLNT
ncbi:hypothetical protein ACLB2K_014765 [Fragaria x ananassa]